jgi:hypothetical protein
MSAVSAQGREEYRKRRGGEEVVDVCGWGVGACTSALVHPYVSTSVHQYRERGRGVRGRGLSSASQKTRRGRQSTSVMHLSVVFPAGVVALSLSAGLDGWDGLMG